MNDEIENDILKRFPAFFKGKTILVSIKDKPELGKREMKWISSSPNGKLTKLSVTGDPGAHEWHDLTDLKIHDVLK